MTNGVPRISLCMIVKDEAEFLPRFLAGVEGLWDELIVVDSLSTDDTPGIVRAAGGTLLSRPWTHDFAAARNAGLVVATGDWVLVLDPDEMVSAETRDSLRRIAGDPLAGAAMVNMRNPMPHGHSRTAWLLRMFRNRPANRYAHAIHEDVSEPVLAMLGTERLELRRASGDIEHLGYVRERARAKDKKERDATLLRACVSADPTDSYSWAKLMEVGLFWRDPALALEGAEGLTAALGRLPPQEVVASAYAPQMLEMLGRARFGGQPARERQHLAFWLVHLPHSAELHFRMGMVCEAAGHLADAGRHYVTCLGLQSRNPQLVNVRPRVGLARLAMARADWSEGRRQAEEALGVAPLDVEALVAWWVCAIEGGFPPRPIAFRIEATLGATGATAAAYVALTRAATELGMFDVIAVLASHSPDAGTSVWRARRRLALGDPSGARALLSAASEPEAAVGLLVCDLMQGLDSSVEIELTLAEATSVLRAWIPFVLACRDPVLVERFVANAAAVAHVFPDLPSWLGRPRRLAV
ncbi:MAG: glycosyltransferase family 2 protein [Myxococcales bacterium]|nr:glycosyltransferase family 2 protein [Myxococcales bacterium]